MSVQSLISATATAAFIGLAALITAPTAHAQQTFSNTAPITIPSVGSATPYPSPIAVTGAPSSIGRLSVTLNGFYHGRVSDVNVLLVSPTGQKTLLMANCNEGGFASDAILTFIPESTATLPSGFEPVYSGVYSCSVYAPPSSLPAPAPTGPYGTSLAPLIGTDANGIWNLYVWDDTQDLDGFIAGGWSIAFNPVTTAFTYQGVLSAGGAPIDGNANVRFALYNSPMAIIGTNLGPVLTRSFTGISGGKITTSLDFGSFIDNLQPLWLNIEVESPPGSGFVTLSPRQPITPTPQARVAQFAANATNAASVPWSGLTDVPPNVASAFSPSVAGANSVISYSAGKVGIGTATPAARMELSVNAGDGLYVHTANESPWALRIGNDVATSAGFQTGMYVTNSGFFRITNRIANPNGTYAQLGTNGAWTALSDERLKTDVTPAEGNLAAAMKLRPVNFRWKSDGVPDFGLIAQEVRAVLPSLVTGDQSNDFLTINYSQLSVVAIGAIQELKMCYDSQLEAIKDQLKERDAENAELKARLERLEQFLRSGGTSKP